MGYYNASKMLFGNTQPLSASVYVPLRIECVDNWAPAASDITRQSIAGNNTLYPFFSLTYPPDFRAEADRILNGGAPAEGFYRKSPWTSRRSWVKYLKYCPMCAVDDTAVYGETYWHRQHQLPEMFYCMKHKVRLVDSDVPLKKAARWFYPASDAVNLDYNTGTQDNLIMYREKLLKIGQECEWLIAHGLEIDWMSNGYEKYQRMFRDKGISSVLGNFKSYLPLYTAIDQYWGKDFLDTLFMETDDSRSDWWTHLFNRAYTRTFKPLYYILLMCMLTGSICDFINSSPADNLFGHPPYICENSICHHYHIDGADIVDIRYLTNNGATATFECAGCGMRYKINKSKVSREQPVIIDRGHLWFTTLREFSEDKQISVLQMAEALNCSVSRIQFHRKQLGLSKPVHFNVELGPDTYYKSCVAALCEEYDEVTIALLNEKVPGAYCYLIEHDYDWLRSHIVYVRELKCHKENDAELLLRVQDAVAKIMQGTLPNHRLTLGYIAQAAGVNIRELKSPRNQSVRDFLRGIVESYDDWLRRRVAVAWKNRIDSGKPITIPGIWYDLKLKEKRRSKHENYLIRLLDELNDQN